MKKILLSLLILITAATMATAETVPGTPLPVVPAEQPAMPVVAENSAAVLPQPYEDICMLMSNGKDSVLKHLEAAVAEKIGQPEPKIFEALGTEAGGHYAGDPLLGMAKFCGALEFCENFNAQLQAVAAFAKGYKKAGVVIIPLDCTEGEPQTELALQQGKFAWFIPFRSGTNFKLTLLGKKDATAKVWKILGDKPVCKEWKGGFWEREITVEGKGN